MSDWAGRIGVSSPDPTPPRRITVQVRLGKRKRTLQVLAEDTGTVSRAGSARLRGRAHGPASAPGRAAAGPAQSSERTKGGQVALGGEARAPRIGRSHPDPGGASTRNRRGP